MKHQAFSHILAGAQNNVSRLICTHEKVQIRLLGVTVDTVLEQGPVSSCVASKIGCRVAIRILVSRTVITKHSAQSSYAD